MTIKEMKAMQIAADNLCETIRNMLDCRPYEAPECIKDAFYSVNTLWMELQKMIEEKED